MARNFVRASSQYLEGAAPLATGTPITLACWHRHIDAAATGDTLLALTSSTDANVRVALIAAPGTALIYAQVGSAVAFEQFNTPFTIGPWQHFAATFASPTTRTIYSNGAGAVNGNGVAITPGGLNVVSVGRLNLGGAPGNYADGDIAEAAIWNVGLTALDVAALAAGVSPLLVRPEALVFYAPLMGQYAPEIDRVGHRDLTVTGATASAHPRIFNPEGMVAAPRWGAALGAAGRTLATFGPEHADLLPVGSMTHAIRNGHRVLEALAGAAESATFAGVLPRTAYLGGRISVTLYWLAKTATTGTAGWDVTLERDNAANHDLDADAWVAIVPTPLMTVDPIAGNVMTTTVTLTPSADLELIAAGDPFRLRVRSLAAGTATGNRQLLAVELRAT